MPASCRKWAKAPQLLRAGNKAHAIAFSRLTLTAQLEVLSQPAETSWKLCAPLNPFLQKWQKRAATQALQVSRWPGKAGHWLGADVYGRKFHNLLNGATSDNHSEASAVAAQEEFIRLKLSPEYLYPLLWRQET
jgi:hypothetical protein